MYRNYCCPCHGFIELYLPLQSPRTHNIAIPKRKITSLLTIHPQAEPYRIEHSSSQFGSARIIFEPYIVECEHWDPNSVRLALENSERGGDSGSKMLGTVRCGSRVYDTGSPVGSPSNALIAIISLRLSFHP